ncbi:hypothetical protein BU17DRAFT_71546 [Hysterangium stoloniferum]|nr:hypothetical protein BU17DRAFT_71546 [Hysterangium stoloniferum]
MTTESRRSSASHKHWDLNWWDLWPLVDGERRPLQWTSESLILSSHPTIPAVIARVFPSSSSFMLPSPGPVLNNPTAYFPPRIIEVSSENDNIFAYFESKAGDNIACIWTRGETVDTWKVGATWAAKQGEGFVAAKWLAEERTWFPGSPPVRTPPIGPRDPLCKPGLLIVTQNHTVQLVHQTAGQLQVTLASLRYPSREPAYERQPLRDIANGSGGVNVCVKAAIGLGYNESSILIATASTLVPPSSAASPEIPEHLGAVMSASACLPPTPWENFGTERTINLCKVKLTFNNFILTINTNPLPPLYPQVALSNHLTDILIIPHLSTEISEPILQNKNTQSDGNWMEIVLAYIDVEDYMSPKSNLISFELKRSEPTPTSTDARSSWTHRYLHSRTFTETAVSFVAPSRRTGSAAILIGLLDMEGFVPRQSNGDKKIKEVRIGRISRLHLPQLTDDESWESSALMVGIDEVGANPPLSAALSPNELLICTSPSIWSNQSKISVILLSNHSPADLVYLMSKPTFPFSSVVRVLELTSRRFDQTGPTIRDWHFSMAQVITDTFRSRSKHISSTESTEKDKKEKELLDRACVIAHDLCSVKAVKGAFEASKEDEGYDMDPVWHLTALATWLVDFSEKIARTMAVQDAPPKVLNKAPLVKVEVTEVEVGFTLLDDNVVPTDDLTPSTSPILITIIHPYMLDNFIGALFHLNTFRAFLDTLTASKLKAGIAKEVIVDIIDGSGINLKQFEAELRKIQQLEELTSLDGEHYELLRRCFCFMFPLPPMHKLITKACSLVTSPHVISKARLFIKPADLVDGISRLNLSATKAGQERDVVSKGILGIPNNMRTCVRCGGKTETMQSRLPPGRETIDYSCWAMWKHEWDRCICGGLWIKGSSW